MWPRLLAARRSWRSAACGGGSASRHFSRSLRHLDSRRSIALDRSREQLALFRKAMFGPCRERSVPGPDHRLLFEAIPLDAKQSEDTPAAMPESPTKPRRNPFEIANEQHAEVDTPAGWSAASATNIGVG